MRSEVEAVLRHEIEHVFGRSIISSRDCIDLSEEIYKRTQQQLNPNTLRRFFGLVKAEYPASQSTLAILSKYCGYYSVEDAYRQKKAKSTDDSIDQESLIYYFDSLFREMTLRDVYDKHFFTVVKHTIKFLNNNIGVADRFQRMISKTRNGQDVYFEQFVNIDKLNDYYGDGLRYYLNEKQTAEAIVFANSLLVFKYWLTAEPEKLKQHAESILNEAGCSAQKYFVCARQFAAILYHSHATGANINETLINIYRYHGGLNKDTNAYQRAHFEYVIAEALTLTGHYLEALYYLGQTYPSLSNKSMHLAFFTEQNYKLLKALCLYKLGREPEAGFVFDEIKPSDFLFINKKFAGILYHYLAAGLRRKNIRYRQSLSSLIRETGFAIFESTL